MSNFGRRNVQQTSNMDIRYHYIRECTNPLPGQLLPRARMQYHPTNHMSADAMTKALVRKLFHSASFCSVDGSFGDWWFGATAFCVVCLVCGIQRRANQRSQSLAEDSLLVEFERKAKWV